MSDAVPDEVWRRRILPSLLVHELVCVRATCRAKSALVTAGLLVERIDASLARLTLTGLIDIDRTAPLSLTYVLRVAYVLEQGSSQEWRRVGVVFIRLAAIYRLTPASGLPLVLPAQWLMANLLSKTTFHQLPLAMAIYRLFGHILTSQGQSLALQQAGNGAYRIGNVSFGVVQLSDLPHGNDYATGYQRTDPVIRWDNLLYPSFSSFLLRTVLVWWRHGVGVGRRHVLTGRIIDNDPRYRRLLTEAMSEQQHGGIAVDYRWDGRNLNHANPTYFRCVSVSGFRPGERVAAYVEVGVGDIRLLTTERPVGDRSQPLVDRYPISMPRWRAVLRHFGVEDDVINRGRVLGGGDGVRG
ncbi:unnamed protein product [Vitrella brassicaformis CCMP3155]|uniref:Uncharacterized protein n=1 Tax=Vitrella brassicaformis (strain CCMP3155) TaxID=1169540 RepID=A0A0G4EPZ9_VITBC|nr:unnamed protein product [Vitrella brassicaformis CCMP3155]|eukprot:CEL99935.1 unnamed protein product [Vitrella brassicaformis CCMP3155]